MKKRNFAFAILGLTAAYFFRKKRNKKEELIESIPDDSEKIVSEAFLEIIACVDELENIDKLEDFEIEAAKILEKTENIVAYVTFHGSDESIEATLEFQEKIADSIKEAYKKF